MKAFNKYLLSNYYILDRLLNLTTPKHLDDEQGAPKKEDDTHMANSTLGLCKS